MATVFYPQFDLVRINSAGVRSLSASTTINAYNVTAAASLGTLTSTADGVIVQGSFTATAGDVVEFSHATYPGTFRITLQATQEKAYTEFDSDTAAFVLENLRATRNSDLVRVFAKDADNPAAPPFEIGAGKPGTTISVPYQTNITQNLELYPVSYTERNKSQANWDLDEALKQDIEIPATGGGEEFVYLERDYANSVQDAIDDNPTDPVVLRVEGHAVIDDDNYDFPDNITVDFAHGGSFEVDSGLQITIAKAVGLDPAQRYFSGDGEVVLGRNASGGTVYADWWCPPEADEDDNHAVNQARASVANGGKLVFGDRLYYIDNQEIVENMFVDGAGNDIDGSGYSSTYTGKGTRFVPSNLASTNPLWYATGFFRNCGISNCAISVQQSTTAKCLALLGTGPSLTSGTGFRATNVSFQSYLADANATTALARPLVTIDGSAYWAEIVNVVFDHCTGLAAGDYTNIYHVRSANTHILFHQCTGTASTGGALYDLEAYGWIKFTHGDERKGSPSYTLTTIADRTVTCNFTAATRLLTATSGSFDPEDTSQEVVKSGNIPANTYITEVLSPSQARVSAATSDFTGGSVAINRYGKSSSTLGYTVLRIRGTGSTLTYDGGADEAFENFLVYERGQYGGVINITNRLIQAAITLKSGLGVLNLRGCDIYSGALKDLPGSWTITAVDTGTETITLNSAHEFIPGQVVYFSTTGSLPGGLSAATPYYVIATPAPNTFRVSATSGGSAVNLTSAGSGTNTALNPLGGGSVSINVDGCSVSRFSLVNYLTTETPVLWQRREGASGLFKHDAWYEDYDIGGAVSSLRQVREVPLPMTIYDPNPSAAGDETGGVLTIGHESSDKTLLRIGLIDPVSKNFTNGFHVERNSGTGDHDWRHYPDGFELYWHFTNFGLKAAAGIYSTSPVYGIGYKAGAGGTVTQATSKSTGVTLNKICGEITMNNAALAAGTPVNFTLTNSAIAATDRLDLDIVSGAASLFDYELRYTCGSGSAVIYVKNISVGSLSEAMVIRYEVRKIVTS